MLAPWGLGGRNCLVMFHSCCYRSLNTEREGKGAQLSCWFLFVVFCLLPFFFSGSLTHENKNLPSQLTQWPNLKNIVIVC